MNVKKILLFGMLILAVSMQSQAQERGERPRRVRPDSEQMIAAMKERLNLSDDQVTKIKKIYTDSRAEFAKLRGENEEMDQQRREEFRKLREKQQKDINEVLTEEQQKEFKAWREERQGQRRRPRPQRNER